MAGLLLPLVYFSFPGRSLIRSDGAWRIDPNPQLHTGRERERETAVVPTDVRSQVGRQKAIDRQAGGSTWTAKMRSLSLTQCTCV